MNSEFFFSFLAFGYPLVPPPPEEKIILFALNCRDTMSVNDVISSSQLRLERAVSIQT